MTDAREPGQAERWKRPKYIEESRAREENFIRLRAAPSSTFAEIAEMAGLSRERVRQIVLRGHRRIEDDRRRVELRAESGSGGDVPIDAIEWSVRTYNGLTSLGAKTIGDVAKLSNRSLRSQPNVGRKTVNEVRFILHRHGLKLTGDTDYD